MSGLGIQNLTEVPLDRERCGACVIDEDRDMLDELGDFLYKKCGFSDVYLIDPWKLNGEAETPAERIAQTVERVRPELVLCGSRMPYKDDRADLEGGLYVTGEIRKRDADVVVIGMTVITPDDAVVHHWMKGANAKGLYDKMESLDVLKEMIDRAMGR